MSRHMPEPGDVIGGKYAVERVLGRGGMGTVYLVHHNVTGKKLALKCLLPEHLDDDDIVRRFVREAQAAGRIQHRHVVDVFDVGQDDALLYMVMPMLEGKTLSQLLRDDEVSLEELLGIVARAMEGVAAAHAQGIIHRDLKPDNIFVCVGPSGRLDDPRVLDFGISKRDDEMQGRLTRSGVMMGTPYYMSFEQINSQRDLDQRVDVYAMGVILYEAVAGILPHVAESIGQLAIRMMGTPPPHLATLRPDLPAGLADVIMKSIARDRDDRFFNMQEFGEALRPYYVHGRHSLVPDGVGTPLRTSRAPDRNRGNDATVPMKSPVPQPLRTTNTSMSSSAPRMLRGSFGEHTPARIIAPSSGNGLWIVLGLLAVGAVGAGIWMFRPQAAKVVEKAAPAVVPAAKPDEGEAPAEPPEERATPPANEATGGSLEERASEAEKPKKKRKKRRKVVKTTHENGKAKSVVLFIEDDAGTYEDEPEGEADTAPDAEPSKSDETNGSPNDQKAQPPAGDALQGAPGEPDSPDAPGK